MLVNDAGKANGPLREPERMAGFVREVAVFEQMQNLAGPNLLAIVIAEVSTDPYCQPG